MLTETGLLRDLLRPLRNRRAAELIHATHSPEEHPGSFIAFGTVQPSVPKLQYQGPPPCGQHRQSQHTQQDPDRRSVERPPRCRPACLYGLAFGSGARTFYGLRAPCISVLRHKGHRIIRVKLRHTRPFRSACFSRKSRRSARSRLDPKPAAAASDFNPRMGVQVGHCRVLVGIQAADIAGHIAGRNPKGAEQGRAGRCIVDAITGLGIIEKPGAEIHLLRYALRHATVAGAAGDTVRHTRA